AVLDQERTSRHLRRSGEHGSREREGRGGGEDQALQAGAMLFDADALADDEIRRLDAGVEREQLLDARPELDRDVAERLAGLEPVVAATPERDGGRRDRRVDGLRAE